MEEKDLLYRMRHSAAHLLAMAVLKLRPEAKLGIGPVIDNGFYYDFDLDTPLTPEDLATLAATMHELVEQDFAFTKASISREEAKEKFANQPYKLELIADIPESEELTTYTSGDFTDLCRGPHVEHSGQVSPHFQLTTLAGAYWRGDEKKPMLQRVYGVLFETSEELDAYMDQMEAAKKRDHRKLGQELDLFTFSDMVGAGLPLFTPRGAMLRNLLVKYLQSIQEPLGFESVWIPHMAKPELYKTSGHWDKFKEDLFHVTGKNDEKFVLKPMNCPHHNQIYASKPRSYRDLPIRYAEVTTNYRDEQTGELHGLSRVRSITQDDGHVYCMPDQVQDEVMRIYNIIQTVYKTFEMPLKVRLSLRDPEHKEKYLGTDEVWEKAEGQLKEAMSRMDEESYVGVGEATFYGPKLDFMATDAIGRDWQVATIQLDFNQPDRFKLVYTDADGQEKQPVMIHRAIYGSLERFLSILIEHYAGDFPLWLAPVQVAILPISDKFLDYAKNVESELTKHGIRVTTDTSNESIGKKIRNAEMMKYPLMLIVGQKEVESSSVSVRVHNKSIAQPEEAVVSLDQFLDKFSFDLPKVTT
jgi:threonyl-tRNA synthetase